MQSTYKYFNELKQHLEALNREIEASYEIPAAGHVDGLMQSGYRVSATDTSKLDKFSFRCVCARSGVLQVHQNDPASVAAYRDFLRSNGLQAKVRDVARGGALFMVQPSVPVVVEFSADFERGTILLRTRNLNGIGVGRHTLTMDQINEKFLDEIAKCILRQANSFEEMVGISISETGKFRLKKKIQEAVRQKQLNDEKEQRAANKDSTITRRFTRSLLGRKD